MLSRFNYKYRSATIFVCLMAALPFQPGYADSAYTSGAVDTSSKMNEYIESDNDETAQSVDGESSQDDQPNAYADWLSSDNSEVLLSDQDFSIAPDAEENTLPAVPESEPAIFSEPAPGEPTVEELYRETIKELLYGQETWSTDSAVDKSHCTQSKSALVCYWEGTDSVMIQRGLDVRSEIVTEP